MLAKLIILVCVILLIFCYDSSHSSTLSQCNEVKDCSSYVNKSSPNKKKMLNGIKDCLLDDYAEGEFKLIPPQESNDTFPIRYQYFVNDLISVEKDVAEVELIMNLFWRDDCLRWNDTDFPYIMLNATDIWRPPVFISSTITPISTDESNQIIVHSNGDCEESLLLKLKIICEENPFYFPNDFQLCRFNFKMKLSTNFSLSPYNESEKNCVTNNVELGEWFIDCEDFNNVQSVNNTNEHWPFLSKATNLNSLYLGNVNGTFKLNRFPHSTYSSIVLPSLIVCVCSQIISLIPPTATNFATILSSLFLSLTVILNNIPSFNKFALFSLLLNWIYCLCASNVLIIIIGTTIASRKKPCLTLFQRFYPKICLFNKLPISFCLILSLTITLPILGALLFKRVYGFLSGIVFMIIIWIIIAVYKIFARISSVRLKAESEGKQKTSSQKNPKSKLDDEQVAKLTTAVNQLTLVMQQFSESQRSASESVLRARSTASRREPSDGNNKSNPSSKRGDGQENTQAETRFNENAGGLSAPDDHQPINEERVDFDILPKKEITIETSAWNGKLAHCICRMWNCVQIIGNIFLNLTLWIIYYRIWETSF